MGLSLIGDMAVKILKISFKPSIKILPKAFLFFSVNKSFSLRFIDILLRKKHLLLGRYVIKSYSHI